MDIFSSKLDKLVKAFGIDEIDEIKKQISELGLTQCQEMLKEKDTRFERNEKIYKQNMDEKHAELLSEKNRLAHLKEFISSHAKCVGCKKKFDSLLHIPYVLTCGHTICSHCFFNIPIITDEENARYNEYVRDAKQPSGFFSQIAQMIPLGEPQETFQKRIVATRKKIEEQQTHLQGFEHIGKCPECNNTPQRGLRYDLLASFNAVKEFSFGKNKRNKKSKSIKRKSKRKSIKNIKNKKSKRKSIKKSKNKRKSIKKSKNKRKSIKRNKK